MLKKCESEDYAFVEEILDKVRSSVSHEAAFQSTMGKTYTKEIKMRAGESKLSRSLRRLRSRWVRPNIDNSTEFVLARST